MRKISHQMGCLYHLNIDKIEFFRIFFCVEEPKSKTVGFGKIKEKCLFCNQCNNVNVTDSLNFSISIS